MPRQITTKRLRILSTRSVFPKRQSLQPIESGKDGSGVNRHRCAKRPFEDEDDLLKPEMLASTTLPKSGHTTRPGPR